jgi:hypothetical protein
MHDFSDFRDAEFTSPTSPAPSSGLCAAREDRINVAPSVQNTDDLDRGISHAIEDNVRLNGNRSNASKQLVTESPGMWPPRKCLARSIKGSKLLVSNVKRCFAGYVDPNGEKICSASELPSQARVHKSAGG